MDPALKNLREWVLLLFVLFCVLSIAGVQYGSGLADGASPTPNPDLGQIVSIVQGPRGAWYNVYITEREFWILHGLLASSAVALNATGWETQTGSVSGVTANDIVNAVPGAFAFAHGSKDSALLVTLQPGGYTANVESVGGSTGVALIEAYEVDRNNNKLFNLSTRAYASSTSPIFAGFVVQGDPGTTKRILIRAQGPSLAKYGINAPLSDPVLELYNANSTLIMANDDWTVNASNTGGTPDDAKPVAVYYSEVQIAATGFNPLNRREPCIMIDLAPGLYSAVIRPFNSVSQPATPGVAIVEVYEVH